MEQQMQTRRVKSTYAVQTGAVISVSNFTIKYPFYAKVLKTAAGHHANLYGKNNEITFTSEPHKNRLDVVTLLRSWFPQIRIKK